MATDLQGPAAIYSRSTVFSLTRGWSLTVCDLPYGIQWSIKQNEWLSAGTPWLITEAAKMDLTFPIRWVIPEKDLHWSRGKIISLGFFLFCFVVVVRENGCEQVKQRPTFSFIANINFENLKSIVKHFPHRYAPTLGKVIKAIRKEEKNKVHLL